MRILVNPEHTAPMSGCLGPSHSNRGGEEYRRWSVFLAGSCLLAVIWLAMLPKLNSIDHLRREIELLEQRGIDPSAMFYTELDAMERVHLNVRETERLHHEAFWMPSYAIERKETGPLQGSGDAAIYLDCAQHCGHSERGR